MVNVDEILETLRNKAAKLDPDEMRELAIELGTVADDLQADANQKEIDAEDEAEDD